MRAAGDAREQQVRRALARLRARARARRSTSAATTSARDALRRRAPRREPPRSASKSGFSVRVDGRRSCRARTRARSARPRARARPARPGSSSRSSSRVAQLVLRVEVARRGRQTATATPLAVRHGARASVARSAVAGRAARARRPPRPAAPATPRQSRRRTSGVGLAPVEVVVVLAVDALDVRDVLEAAASSGRATRAPRRVSTALMPIVVPTTTCSTSAGVERRALQRRGDRARPGSPGSTAPSRRTSGPSRVVDATRSVNVPPVSMPTLIPMPHSGARGAAEAEPFPTSRARSVRGSMTPSRAREESPRDARLVGTPTNHGGSR